MASGRVKMTGSSVLRGAGVPRGTQSRTVNQGAYSKMKAIEARAKMNANTPKMIEKKEKEVPRKMQLRNQKRLGHFA